MKIVYVDGFKIRNTLDDDFGVLHGNSDYIGSFSPKFYIPKDEIWVDFPFKKETGLFFKIEDYYNDPNNLQLINEYQKNKSKFIEERRGYIKSLCEKGVIPNFEIKRELLEDGLNLVYVDGSIIRKYIDPEFIFGGHSFVYSYVPEKEIWVDNLMNPLELPYIVLHEKIERKLMEKEGKNYDVAHDFATVYDKEARIKDGYGMYPGSENYKWGDLSNEEIIKQYVI
ncbi:MAG: hypothetical protein AAB890_00970 [Patescibacteria group bacterium]